MATIFRPPVFVRLYARPKAQAEYVVNLSVLFSPNPAQPFNQTEWRAPARIPLSLKSDSYWGALPLYAPNPSIPFNQKLWEGAAKPRLKAIGETLSVILRPLPFSQVVWERANPRPANKGDAYASPNTLVTPNPARPFAQYEWRPLARIPLSLKSDSYAGVAPILTPNPILPFTQNLWEGAAKSRKAVGEAFSDITILDQPPFSQTDWPLAARRGNTALTWIDAVNLALIPFGDTHDGVFVKRKRTRRGRDVLDLELESRAKRRADIERAVYGDPIQITYELPEPIAVRPPPDVMGLAQAIMAAQSAERQAEQERFAQDDESDLEMILGEL